MPIRRLQYSIDYIHILTFNSQYKRMVAPYFALDGVEYAIDNDNTLDESIRLVFRNENTALVIRKEAILLIFEGELEEIKNPNGIIRIFWEMFEKISKFSEFSRSTRHILIAHSVSIKEREQIETVLENNEYLSKNPFGKLNEFACLYEFRKDDIEYKFNFGNYNPKDIKKHDLMPFKTKYNEDLLNNVGLMARMEAIELDKHPTHSKFKSLLSKAENYLTHFNLD